MTDWDKRFLELAAHVAQWSKDPSTKVGAVIVDSRRRVVAMGYNGFPRGIEDDDRLLVREEKYPRIMHAELNSILNCPTPLFGCDLFLWPLPPCSECAKPIIQSGILSVCWPKDVVIPTRWEEDCAMAWDMLTEAGIKMRTA